VRLCGKDLKLISSLFFFSKVTPNTRFIKKWRVKNCGNIRWPPGSSLRLISGAVLSQKEINLVDTLNPDDEMDISVEM
jgi:hypothetical protein